MSALKKFLTVIVFVFLTMLNSASSLVNSSVSVEQKFSTNLIIVNLTHEASMKNKTYTPLDFAEVNPDQVVEGDPYTYELFLKYLDGQTIDSDKLNVETYERCLFIKWNKDLSKEKIIENIHILEKREDISYAQPNYLYELDGSIYESRYDYVANDIWTNYYHIKVTSKDDLVYFNDDNLRQNIIEAELLKSYNKLVEVENDNDKLLNEVLVDGKFKFCVPDDLYDELNVGYEYIIKLDSSELVRNKKEQKDEYVLKYEKEYPEHEVLRVINNRLYYTYIWTYTNSKNDIKQEIGSNQIFCRQLNYFIFKKTFVKNDLPFEFEIEIKSDPAGDMIEIVINDEEKDKVDPNKYYVYYYYKCGVFLLTGDDVLMFDEYIKLAKGVHESGNLYEPEDVQSLREQAKINISQQRNKN